MANNISGAGLSDIYTRINGIDQYHPFETETFSDWSTQSGDIVKVKRGEEAYDSPIHTARMVWKGAPQMSLSSTGNQKRDAIAKVSKKKYRGGSGGLRNEEYIYKEFTSSDGKLWSSIFMSESKLETIFANGISSISSRITQTAEEINASVWGEESSIYSALKMTATNIVSTVGDELEDIHTEIEQTKSMIRNAVWTANSTVFTYIEQTASYILDHVGERSGARVLSSMTAPQDTPGSPLTPGDIWIEGSLINTWDDFPEGTPWVDYDPTAYQYDWLELSGQQVHVWRDGKWNLVEDGTKLVEDTWFMRTKDTISQIAGNVEKIDGEFRKNLANLSVKADRISATVTQHGKSIGEIGSNITQTATQIRAEVHAANSTLYSYIDMTATYIKTEVANTTSELRSNITQQADKIALVVESTASGNKIKPASIVAAINNGSSSVIISADHINLDGYVKATDITADLITTKLALASNVNAKKLTLTNNGYIVLPSGDGSISITGSNASDIIRGLKVVSSGNGYKLQAITYGDSSWHDLPNSSFSRAVSSWVWGGGSGKINVTPLPQNQTKSINVSIDGTNTITSNGTYTYTVDYENADGDDVSTGATKSVTVNIKSAADYYNASSFWKKPMENSGVCTIPNISVNASETWFTMNSITVTRASWHSTMGTVYSGKLYYWDDDAEEFTPVVNSNKYWYYSNSNKSGTSTLYY